MLVRAIRKGYYEHVRRNPGDVFHLVEIEGHKKDAMGKLTEFHQTPEMQFSENWMEKVEDGELDGLPVAKSKKAKPVREPKAISQMAGEVNPPKNRNVI